MNQIKSSCKGLSAQVGSGERISILCTWALAFSSREHWAPLYSSKCARHTDTFTHIHTHLVVWIRSWFSCRSVPIVKAGWLQPYLRCIRTLTVAVKKYQKSITKLFEKWHFKVENTSPNNNLPLMTKVNLEFKAKYGIMSSGWGVKHINYSEVPQASFKLSYKCTTDGRENRKTKHFVWRWK